MAVCGATGIYGLQACYWGADDTDAAGSGSAVRGRSLRIRGGDTPAGEAGAAAVGDMPGQPGKSVSVSHVDVNDALCRLLGLGGPR